MVNYKWTDKEIKNWGKKYLSKKKITLYGLEDITGVSHSTLWWCFMNRLKDIDFEIYGSVVVKLENNRHRGGRRIGKGQSQKCIKND